MFKIVFTDRALKDWSKLEKDAKKRIANKLQEYARDPLQYARKLVDDKIVLRIGHRKEVYR